MFERLKLDMSKVYPTLVVSTMSSGKSTLINALVGTDLLPSMNRACTAKAVAVLDNDLKPQFVIHAVDENGNYSYIEQATKQVIAEYNKSNKTSEMVVEGEIQGIRNSKKSMLLIDTPGINNSMDSAHEMVTRQVLEDYSEGLILYVINAQQIGTNDDSLFLTYIAQKLKENPKFSILFAVNKMDLIDPERENPEELIENCKNYIESKGILAPVLIPISAASALLFKKVLQNQSLSEKEKEDFIKNYRYFKREGLSLQDYMDLLERGLLSKEIEIDEKKFTRAQVYAALENTGIPFLEKVIDETMVKSLKMLAPAIDIIDENDDSNTTLKKELQINREGDKAMVKVQISYNPYTVKTDLLINGKKMNEEVSPLSFINGRRLQEWIEPRENWAGIFKVLRTSVGDSQITIEFTGTSGDFQDVVYAKDNFGTQCFDKIELIHKNKETAKNADPYSKMNKLKELYQELQNGPVEEFKTPDIQKNFETAMNSEFKIVVIAPMSSGKSTLINAIIGRDMLPAVNQATTAVITEIKDNDNLQDFIVNADDKYGNNVVENQKATKDLISELNYRKDPKDPEGKEALIHLVKLEGPIPGLPSDVLSTVFVDTPGGNNSQNSEHEAMMDEAINDENKSLILYVFNGAQLGTNDSNIILRKIANAMKNSTNGKQSRDRFLFVANRMDEYDTEKEKYEDVIENTILMQLENNGIENPNLFLASAQTAKLIRMAENGEVLSETEEENLEMLVRRFNRDERMLPKYASLPSSVKEEFVKNAKQYAEIGKKAENGKEAVENKYKAAEINSGIPAIELAIKEYLEKYAIAIKIKTAHDTFMKKVIERNMINNCEAEWAKSQESFDAIKEELQQKQEKYDYSKKQEEFRDKVDAIEFNTEFVEHEKAEIINKITGLLRETEDTIKRSEADYKLAMFRNKVADIGEEAQLAIDDALNNGVRLSCQRIIEEYAQYIQDLSNDGVFRVGNYDMKQTQKFEMFELKKVDDLLNQKYKVVKDVWVGYEKKEKKGFRSSVARLFGMKSFLRADAYEYVDKYEQQEFVSFKQLVQEQITEVQHSFDKQIKNEIEDAEKEVNILKNLTKEKLAGLDLMIKEQLDEINELLASQEELEKKVAANEEKAKWVNDFIKQVDDLLTV